MQFAIEHEVPGRIRVKLNGVIPNRDVDALYKVLSECPAATSVSVYPRIGGVAVSYDQGEGTRDGVIDYLRRIDGEKVDLARSQYTYELAPKTHELLMDIAGLVGRRLFMRAIRVFVPAPLKFVTMALRYRKFLAEALDSLLAGRLDVPVLDAAAIGIAFVQRDMSTAANTMFLLRLGETLENYTRAASQNQLINSLLAVPESAQLIVGKEELKVSAAELKEGDLIAIRTGAPVPIDGVIERGVAMVNQAALTGEPLALERVAGDDVFAGTAVEEGEIFVRVRKSSNETKLRSIVSLVEASAGLMGVTEERRARLADAIVPWNFLLAGIVALTTRSLTKTAAALMVDYSCALRLTGSVSVLSAMSQAAESGFTVKGSRHFESVAGADTIVFDKTGTLTDAAPRVTKIIGWDGWRRDMVLRLSACLEEHYPHPVARAVVAAAEERNIKHRERHAEVEYIVAHGLASSLEGKRVVLGSRHFVLEDEGVALTDEQIRKVDAELDGLTVLYLAVDGQVVGALGIEDPLKEGAAEAVRSLRDLGFEHVVMLTGDNELAARRAAEAAGITEFEANMLPEDKHLVIERLKAEGRRVVMVGDGVNDSPALSLADVGIAMESGTAIAKEVADITLTSSDLDALVRLKRMSDGLMGRLDTTFKGVIGFNSLLLALGIAGVITPQVSSLLHNGSTVALGLTSSRAYGV